MIKLFAYILSVYVMALTAVPCIDEPVDPTWQITHDQSSTETDHPHNETDHCSPFCTCNCCATPVISAFEYHDFTCHSFTYQDFPELSIPFYPTNHASIWQPPQLNRYAA